ncbi:hypothetical protein RRG12_11610 [Nostoc sp. CALU 546]
MSTTATPTQHHLPDTTNKQSFITKIMILFMKTIILLTAAYFIVTCDRLYDFMILVRR